MGRPVAFSVIAVPLRTGGYDGVSGRDGALSEGFLKMGTGDFRYFQWAELSNGS